MENLSPKRRDLERKAKRLGHSIEWSEPSNLIYRARCIFCGMEALTEDYTNDTSSVGSLIELECPVHSVC